MGPPDAILGITEAYKKDTNPKKINLGVGAYRDDNGNPFVLPSVLAADRQVCDACLNKEYAPISGTPEFCKAAIKLALGDDSKALDRVATVQSISGTGALRIGNAFFSKFFKSKDLYMPTPTWGNHVPLATHSLLTPKQYKYYNPNNCSLDFAGLCENLSVSLRM